MSRAAKDLEPLSCGRSNLRPTRAERAFNELVHRVGTTRIPSAPPRYPSLDRSAGVGILDAVLNLNHVVRRMERLRIVDPSHLERAVTLNLSLDRLTSPQYAACVRMAELRQRPTPHDYDNDGRHPGASALMWVPIARQTRSVTSPSPILDSEGRSVPRLSQPELLPLINAAMYNLLRLALPDSETNRDDYEDVYAFIHRTSSARWLLQQSVADMIYFGSHLDLSEDASDHSIPVPGRPLDQKLEQAMVNKMEVRELTRCVVERHLNPDKQAAFLELLHHASTEYIVAAGLESAKKEHTLSYNSPTLPAERLPEGIGSFLSALAAARRQDGKFTVRYTTHLPRNIDSFHVVVECENGVRMQEAMLSTDYDRPQVREVASQLKTLSKRQHDIHDAERYESGLALRSVHGYELSAALMKLDAIVSRRNADAQVYKQHLETHSVFPEYRAAGDGEKLTRNVSEDGGKLRLHVHSDKDQPNEEFLELLREIRAARDTLSELADTGTTATDGLPGSSVDSDELAQRVEGLELDRDVVADGDPRSTFVHLFWRQRLTEGPVGDPGSFKAQVDVLLMDEPPPFTASVQFYLQTLLGTVAAIGCLLFGWGFLAPWSRPEAAVGEGRSVEALVAVLLVVPGLLLSRLDLPSTSSIAGLFRLPDRLVAWSAVVGSILLGLFLATRVGGQFLVWSMWGVLATLGGLLLWVWLHARERERRRHMRHPGCLQAPRWIVRDHSDYRDHNAMFTNERSPTYRDAQEEKANAS